MPTLDRLVSIGPPSTASYAASLAALQSPAYRIADGDPVADVDTVGEFGFAQHGATPEQTVLIAFEERDPRSATGTIGRRRFANADVLVLVPPANTQGLPRGADLLGGTVLLSISLPATAPIPLFQFDIDSGQLADFHDAHLVGQQPARGQGILTYVLSRYQWLYGNRDWVLPATGGLLDHTPEETIYHVGFDFRVRLRQQWAMLLETSAIDSVTGTAASTAVSVQRRQYRIRQTVDAATTFEELTDADGKWNIVAVEPEGRRRFAVVDCERTIEDVRRSELE